MGTKMQQKRNQDADFDEKDMEKTRSCFANALKSYRKAHPNEKGKEMTQKELAAFLGEGYSENIIKKWETDIRKPDFDQIVHVSNKLKLSCDYLLKGVNSEFIEAHRATGLSEKAIRTLSEFKGSFMLSVLTELLSRDQYIETTFQLNDIVDMKKALFSGENVLSSNRMRNAIRGARHEMVDDYARIIELCTSKAARQMLRKEGKRVLTKDEMLGYADYDDQPYYDDEDDPTVNDEDFAY